MLYPCDQYGLELFCVEEYSLICLTFLLFENVLMYRNKIFTLHKMTMFILSFVRFKLTHYEPL